MVTRPSSALLIFCIIRYSYQACHHTTKTFYRQLSDDLWAMQQLRESVFNALRDTQPKMRSSQMYNSITTLQDGLRRRTIDLYPLLEYLPELRSLQPKAQMELILESLAEQRHIGCAAELLLRSFKNNATTSDKNITRDLGDVEDHGRAECFNEMLDIFWSYLCTCPPSQTLIGAILANLPIRMRVSDARLDTCSFLQEQLIPSDDWRQLLQLNNPRNQTITLWLSGLLRTMANHTNDPDGTEALADGIIQLAQETNSNENSEEVAFRLHPKTIEEAGLYVPATKEDRGIYRIGLGQVAQPSTIKKYKPAIPTPPRIRRSPNKKTEKSIRLHKATNKLR